ESGGRIAQPSAQGLPGDADQVGSLLSGQQSLGGEWGRSGHRRHNSDSRAQTASCGRCLGGFGLLPTAGDGGAGEIEHPPENTVTLKSTRLILRSQMQVHLSRHNFSRSRSASSFSSCRTSLARRKSKSSGPATSAKERTDTLPSVRLRPLNFGGLATS